MRGVILAILAFFSFCTISFADELRLIPFKEAEKTALKNSPQIVAQQYTADSAYQQASSEKMKRFPSLHLNAQSSLTSRLGKIEIPALGERTPLGRAYLR